MEFDLTETLSKDGAAEDDIRALKIALNRLFYYTPPRGIGITEFTDGKLFDALRRFQDDKKLKVTGAILPHDETVEAINRAIEDQPIAQEYIWRTACDDQVRSSHAAREAKRFSWLQHPLPGEEHNCRCWAEPVPKRYSQKQLQTPGIDKINRMPDWEIAVIAVALSGNPIVAGIKAADVAILKSWKINPPRDKLQHIYI